ncbi:hypothetical protein N665_0366s0008 [Sinapis alba]|nr:hypothetical protein N665_0366s0008 [Sinapis alba]
MSLPLVASPRFRASPNPPWVKDLSDLFVKLSPPDPPEPPDPPDPVNTRAPPLFYFSSQPVLLHLLDLDASLPIWAHGCSCLVEPLVSSSDMSLAFVRILTAVCRSLATALSLFPCYTSSHSILLHQLTPSFTIGSGYCPTLYLLVASCYRLSQPSDAASHRVRLTVSRFLDLDCLSLISVMIPGSPVVSSRDIFIASVQHLTAVCSFYYVCDMGSDVLSIAALYWWPFERLWSAKSCLSVNPFLSDNYCHIVSFVEHFIFPKSPLCISGLDVQDLPVLQGSPSWFIVFPAFVAAFSAPVAEHIALVCALDAVDQEVIGVLIIFRLLLISFDKLYLLLSCVAICLANVRHYVPFYLVIPPPSMEFEFF